MGSDAPLITCAMPLGGQLPYKRLYAEALMNTRRKLGMNDLDHLIGESATEIVQKSTHLGTDESGKWVYYRELGWDEGAFSFIAAREFKKPKLSEALKSGLPRTALNGCHSMTEAYFRHNAFIKNLYCTKDLDAAFASSYPKI